MKRYPFIEFVARHGRRLSLAIPVVVALLAVVIFFISSSPASGIAVLVIAILLYPLIRLLAELIEVIADTLMPR